ncbi:MAG: hypothetical protein ACAH95_07610 [Fimbriimonas sp.]
MTVALAALLVLQTPGSLFDTSLRAHAQVRELSARIVLSGTSEGRKANSVIGLYSTPSVLVMRVQEPQRPGLERTDRTYRVSGSRFDGYDAVANERLGREVPNRGTPAEKMAFALGALEEAPAVLLSNGRMKKLFESLKAMPGWKRSLGPGVLKLTRRGAVKGQNLGEAQVLFGAKNHLLRELMMKGRGSELHWTIVYDALKVGFGPPADARRVSAFTVAEAPPKFATREAKRSYERMIRAAAGIRTGTVLIRDQDVSVRLAFQGRSIREGRSGFVWVFDGSSLSVHNSITKKFYRGMARRSDVIDVIAKLGGRVDPWSRYVLLRRVPFKDIVGSGDSVSVGGSMTISGVERTILRAVRARKRVSFSVRSDNRLPDSIQVELLDLDSRLLSSSRRTYEYVRLNGTQPAAEFHLVPPKGTRVLPLPAIKILG